jgi:hypothetical protein
MKIALVGILFLLLGPASSTAATDSGWHWVRVVPRDNAMPVKWDVERGMALNVSYQAETFTADLYSDQFPIGPNSTPDIRLTGTVKNGTVTAYAVYVGTDAGRETFHGTIRAQRDGNFETDRITLKGEWADAFIGITRFVSSRP